jgi:uncharacterized membrane protein
MDIALLFAILAGVSSASYNIFQKFGSTIINPALGAMIISAVAFSVNSLVLFFMKARGQEIIFTTRGLILLIFAGLSAAGIDLFYLLAYSKGLKISSTFIMVGIQTLLILLIGFLILKEPINLGRIIALILIISGILLLQRYGI